MPAAKVISKEMCLAAMNKTQSVKAAARYLNCSYQHLKRYMKLYQDVETGMTLFDKHKNQSGKGIPKFLSSKGKEPALLDIIEGRIDASSFSPEKIKYRLITEGYLEEECDKCCFQERRVTDYKVPLILNFKDKNKKNYNKENIHFLCYNCYFLYIGNVFTAKDIEQLEDHVPLNNTTDAINFELDEYHMQRLKELGLDGNKKDDDDPYNLVSYK
jgi:hypothetical protein|tara:strand:+ start:534 stop:1178 length:645 start_codon:yes stop_codon:yes gene_type:complete